MLPRRTHGLRRAWPAILEGHDGLAPFTRRLPRYPLYDELAKLDHQRRLLGIVRRGDGCVVAAEPGKVASTG